MSLVIKCAGEHFVKLDMKIQMVPKCRSQYYSSLNLPAQNIGAVSGVSALSFSTPSFWCSPEASELLGGCREGEGEEISVT